MQQQQQALLRQQKIQQLQLQKQQQQQQALQAQQNQQLRRPGTPPIPQVSSFLKLRTKIYSSRTISSQVRSLQNWVIRNIYTSLEYQVQGLFLGYNSTFRLKRSSRDSAEFLSSFWSLSGHRIRFHFIIFSIFCIYIYRPKQTCNHKDIRSTYSSNSFSNSRPSYSRFHYSFLGCKPYLWSASFH